MVCLRWSWHILLFNNLRYCHNSLNRLPKDRRMGRTYSRRFIFVSLACYILIPRCINFLFPHQVHDFRTRTIGKRLRRTRLKYDDSLVDQCNICSERRAKKGYIGRVVREILSGCISACWNAEEYRYRSCWNEREFRSK